jgi:hypothetical protein
MISAVGSFVFLLAVQGASAQWTVGQKVSTTSGEIQGHASSRVPEVSEYLGIRFGENTAGKNRFMPPKPYKSNVPFEAIEWVRMHWTVHDVG